MARIPATFGVTPMSKPRLFISLSVLASVLAALTIPPAQAEGTGSNQTAYSTYESAVPGVAPEGSDDTAVFLDAKGLPLDMADEVSEGDHTEIEHVEVAALGPCTPGSGRDNPHRSGTGVAVSGHGWWTKGSCSNNRADVQNCLYEWYTDNTWRQKKCSSTKRLKPGGGSSNRTVARRDCDNTLQTSWRNHVDVDVVGEWDTAEKPMRQAEVNCRVY